MRPLFLEGNGEFETELVGESHYQEALEDIAGAKEEVGKWFECKARLEHEPDNPFDDNAIRVMIDNRVVGYLQRDLAKAYRKSMEDRFGLAFPSVILDAVIVGGWKNSHTEGQFGVKIDLMVD